MRFIETMWLSADTGLCIWVGFNWPYLWHGTDPQTGLSGGLASGFFVLALMWCILGSPILFIKAWRWAGEMQRRHPEFGPTYNYEDDYEDDGLGPPPVIFQGNYRRHHHHHHHRR
jgi:hypothetical protein